MGLLKNFSQLEASGKHTEAMAIVARECIPRRVALQNAYDAQINFNRNGLVASINSIAATGTLFFTITLLTFGIALGGGVFLVLFVVRGINSSLRIAVNEVRVSANEITAASSQVAGASEQLAQGASEQAASLEETSASSHEVSAMTQRHAEVSRNASGLMVEVDNRMTQANQKLEQMVVSMGAITQSSERIAKIIKVIDEIAFQTNILALNAAVEAARAGEAGLGFAVVADEVRNLAQRCAQAARDTTALIEESVGNSRTGRESLDKVTEVIHSITGSAAKVKIIIDEVNHGGQEQARGIDQISQALAQMEQTTQQAAASAEESASASQQLKGQADSLGRVVLSLESLIGSRA